MKYCLTLIINKECWINWKSNKLCWVQIKKTIYTIKLGMKVWLKSYREDGWINNLISCLLIYFRKNSDGITKSNFVWLQSDYKLSFDKTSEKKVSIHMTLSYTHAIWHSRAYFTLKQKVINCTYIFLSILLSFLHLSQTSLKLIVNIFYRSSWSANLDQYIFQTFALSVFSSQIPNFYSLPDMIVTSCDSQQSYL